MEQKQSKVVIITGASSGIGKATAILLARKGAKVVLAARREERLQEIAHEIARAGGTCVYLKTNVSSAEEMKKLAEYTIQQFGRIDVLVNNAGNMLLSQLHEGKVHEWENMIDLNIKGVLYGIHAVLPVMREQKSGHIVTVSSTAGYSADPTGAVYSGTKYAVRAIMEGLRKEESPASNIRSTIVSPGLTDTELVDHISNTELRDMLKQMKQVAMSPDSIARAISYAIHEPDDTSVSEIIVRPTAQFQ